MSSSEDSRYAYDKVQEATDEHGDEEVVFEEYLHRKGLKFTSTRKRLLRKIFGMHDHFTADQLLDRLKGERMQVSKATVYRTLGVMLDCGLLTSHDFGEGALYYEHTHGHAQHQHMFCLACKRILEFKSEALDGEVGRIAGELGFTAFSHSLKVFGLCARCSQDEDLRARYAAEAHPPQT